MCEIIRKGMLAMGKEIKIVAILPNITGFTGDCINERQLIKSLRRFSNVSTYSLLPVSGINKLLDRRLLNRVKEDVNLKLMFVHIGYPYTIGLLLNVLYGLIYTVLATFERPRLIYVRSSGLALFPVILKKVHKAKVVVKIPSLLEEEFRGVGSIRVHVVDRKIFETILKIIERFVMFKADRIAVPSLQFYRELCKRRLIKNRAPPLIVPPGIDLTKIEKIRETDETICSESDEEITIGYVGLLEWWQGVDTLVKAAGILQKEGKVKLRLLIVGDGPARKMIEKLCQELNVQCEFTGFIPHEDALKMMKKMRALVVPRLRTTTTETNIPIKVIEAWALGVPVVITGHKIFYDLKSSVETPALLCESRPRSVADALRLLIYDNQLLTELRDKGLKIAEQFDYNAIAESIRKII